MRSTAALGLALCLTLWGLAGNAGAFSKDSLVWQKCAGCHAPTASGKLPRVEEIRTTPEEWWVIVDRMKRLYGMELGKGEMDALLRELCSTQLLAPEELVRVDYLALQHNSQRMEVPEGSDETHLFATCVRCHTAGKIFSYRMTPEAWAKVRDLHHYVTPTVHLQMREMRWRPEADKALAYLGRKYAYGRAWQAPAASLAGTWFIVGREPGKGNYRGEATLTASGAADYTLKGKLEYADGSSEDFQGDAVLYGGVALRTRTRHNAFETRGAYTLVGGELRGENHFPAPHFRTSAATWVRKEATPRVLRVSPAFLLKGEKTTVTVEGLNLPEVKAADVSLRGGAVKVLKARRLGPHAVELQLVSGAAGSAVARLALKGLEAGSLRLAPRIDYIAVAPGTGRARLAGGPNYPAEGVQFEAVAYSRGARAKDPKDDVALGPVPATFRLAEEKTRPGDDDLLWVGGIGENGTYVPLGEYAPLVSRKYHSEASGWVKVVARYARGRETFRAEGKLAVVPPDFIPRIR